MTKIEIPLNKTRLVFALIIIFFLTLLCIYFFTQAEEIAKSSVFLFFQNSVVNRIISTTGILIFTWVTILGFKKIKINKPGLIIDNNGLNFGLIKWDDKTETSGISKNLLIFIKKPNEILEKSSGFNAKVAKSNIENFGTPILIDTDKLKYDFNELFKIITNKLIEHNNKKLNR